MFKVFLSTMVLISTQFATAEELIYSDRVTWRYFDINNAYELAPQKHTHSFKALQTGFNVLMENLNEFNEMCRVEVSDFEQGEQPSWFSAIFNETFEISYTIDILCAQKPKFEIVNFLYVGGTVSHVGSDCLPEPYRVLLSYVDADGKTRYHGTAADAFFNEIYIDTWDDVRNPVNSNPWNFLTFNFNPEDKDFGKGFGIYQYTCW